MNEWVSRGATVAVAGETWIVVRTGMLEVTVTCALGIAALAAGFQGWALRKTTTLERVILIVAGFALAYPGWIADLVGIVGVLAVLAMQLMRPAPEPQGMSSRP